jgi:hypothetical protein
MDIRAAIEAAIRARTRITQTVPLLPAARIRADSIPTAIIFVRRRIPMAGKARERTELRMVAVV